ncbi:ImmA/IrrE family metallo-endopeptidase [Tardiphaga sp. 866_E4_N2_1]|uniref:ImmA/IrrE family metallo-endopeptidase n=1 Tax=unclassified Tardiphaga TaxID=2631404 RepID=UPI003F249C3E
MRPAETLLRDLGIEDPRDIDLPTIALCVGAEIRYEALISCEAQIVGYKDGAIIYVDVDVRDPRRRFSAAHELGHWHHHRGRSFVCRSDDIGRLGDAGTKVVEREADSYAGDLLLPSYLFGPLLAVAGEVGLETIAELARTFSTSLTATAIRVVRSTCQPLIVIAHDLSGRRWQWSSLGVGGLRIRPDPDMRSSAFTAIAGAAGLRPAKKEPASFWFDRRHVEQFDVRVQSVRTSDGEALTILRILDPKMIDIYG